MDDDCYSTRIHAGTTGALTLVASSERSLGLGPCSKIQPSSDNAQTAMPRRPVPSTCAADTKLFESFFEFTITRPEGRCLKNQTLAPGVLVLEDSAVATATPPQRSLQYSRTVAFLWQRLVSPDGEKVSYKRTDTEINGGTLRPVAPARCASRVTSRRRCVTQQTQPVVSQKCRWRSCAIDLTKLFDFQQSPTSHISPGPFT